jgi:hypothetical protein
MTKPKLHPGRNAARALALAAGLMLAAGTASAQRYIQHNLVSDVPGLAAFTDPNLVNAWGIASSGSGPIWIANNGTGTSTVYNGNGTAVPLVVSIPAGAANTEDGPVPTGLVFNGTSDFVITENSVSRKAVFLFAGEDGTISGWNPAVDATHAVLPTSADLSATGAIFKGLALGKNGSANLLLRPTSITASSGLRFDVRSHVDVHGSGPRRPRVRAVRHRTSAGIYVTFASRTPTRRTTSPVPETGTSTCSTPAERCSASSPPTAR